jgi:hypothetical protein
MKKAPVYIPRWQHNAGALQMCKWEGMLYTHFTTAYEFEDSLCMWTRQIAVTSHEEDRLFYWPWLHVYTQITLPLLTLFAVSLQSEV